MGSQLKMSGMHYLCTYFDSNYLVKGLALYYSLVKQAEPFKLWVLCFDNECWNRLKILDLPHLVPIPLSEFEAGDGELVKARGNRSQIEYYFTSTPSLMLYVLRHNPEVEAVTYVDSDVYFYAGVNPFLGQFKNNSVLIIEHRFSRHQKYSERHGKFNVGYICARRDENGMACLNWWRARCNEWCYDKVEKDRFADQKYLNRWPELFKGVLIWGHRGANLAPWNLSNYTVDTENGGVTVDGEPLLFFHFQGLKKINANTYDTGLRDYGVELSPAIKNHIYLPYIHELEKIAGELNPREAVSAITTRYSSTFRRLLKLKPNFPLIRYLALNPGTAWHLLKLVFNPGASSFISVAGAPSLCIVPLAPPITGASIASEEVVKLLHSDQVVNIIEYQRGSLVSGRFSLRQTVNVLMKGLKILKLRFQGERFDSVYMVVSCTFWGHIRDIFFLLILGQGLRYKTVVHIHSANNEGNISAILPLFLKPLARKVFADVRKGIILSKAWQNVYGTYIDKAKVVEINNFYSPYLLIPESKLSAKFNSPGKVSLLFLGNMIKQKGYALLLDAFLALPQELRALAELNFAGHFDSMDEKNKFIQRIGTGKNIFYHGVAEGENKRELFWKTHVFCLPTAYPYEAQPISILEAYAAGCAVITTENGGICDIFADKTNGFYIENFRNRELLLKNLTALLERTIPDRAGCETIALRNRKEAAEKYSLETFQAKIKAAIFD